MNKFIFYTTQLSYPR